MRLKISIGILVFFFYSATVFAQNSTIKIKGQVLDSLQTPLVGANVMLMTQKDGLLESFGIVDQEGMFNLKCAKTDSFNLQITYVGYGSFAKELIISDLEKDVDFGEIILSNNPNLLGEVVVKDRFLPIVIKKDTVEYHADAFQTQPNAVVEDLLKKLPGIEVEKDGTIKAQGEEVNNILIDGKEFFDGDPKMATKNIPAEIVDKVQLFDKKSDFTAFTGIEDGADEKTINLALKAGKNKGLFGNIEGHYGLENYYKGNLNLNRFNKKMQASLIAKANNINEQVFSIEDYIKMMGGLEEAMSGEGLDLDQLPNNLFNDSGQSNQYLGGLNFNYDFNKKTHLRSNYMTNLLDKNLLSNTENLSFVDGLDYKSLSNSEANDDFQNHRLKLKLSHQINAFQDLIVKSNINFTQQDELNNTLNQSFVLDSLLINQALGNNKNNLNNFAWKNEFIYRRKFNKIGRFFTADLLLKGQEQNQTANIANQSSFYNANEIITEEATQQEQLDEEHGQDYQLQLNYVEPLSNSMYWGLNTDYLLQNRYRQKDFYDQSNDTKIFNEQLSNQSKQQNHLSQIGNSFRWIRSNFNASVSLAYQHTLIQNKSLENNFNKQYNHLLPALYFKYLFSNSQNLNFTYNTQIVLPTLTQLQPTVDNSNPLNITIGNPDLIPAYQHSFNLQYMGFNQFYFRSFFAGINSSITQNAIVNASEIDSQLKTISRPMNTDLQYHINGHYNFESPIKSLPIKFGIRGNLGIQYNELSINSILDQSTFYTLNNTWTISNKSKDKVDLGINYTLTYNQSQYKIQSDFNQNFLTHEWQADFYWNINPTWSFNTDLSYQYFPKGNFDTAYDFSFLNAQLNKSFWENKLLLSLSANNLFNETQRINRNSFANQVSTTEQERLGRIIMIGAKYKISHFGK